MLSLVVYRPFGPALQSEDADAINSVNIHHMSSVAFTPRLRPVMTDQTGQFNRE
jgi:hypothetical protein